MFFYLYNNWTVKWGKKFTIDERDDITGYFPAKKWKCRERERSGIARNCLRSKWLSNFFYYSPCNARTFYHHMRKYKAESRKEVQATNLGWEEPTESETLLENLIKCIKTVDRRLKNKWQIKTTEKNSFRQKIGTQKIAGKWKMMIN